MSTVLVVDDDFDVATYIEANLRIEGFDVLVAHDGAEALEMINSESFGSYAVVIRSLLKQQGIEIVEGRH